MLAGHQVDAFRDRGFVHAEAAVTRTQLAALRAQLAAWIEESRGHDSPYGALCDGRPRFDMAPGHSAESPQLRRVNNPSEISDAFREVMATSAMTDMVAQLIGPAIQFHHDKINLKLPRAGTEVDMHQDFGFTPHSNSDLVTALLFLDDVTMENGPLLCDPGSHKRGQISLYQDGCFTGSVAEAVKVESWPRMVPCTGPAGSVCLMHTLVLHASGANKSAASRNLYIAVYAAADAVALAPSPVPSTLQGLMVRGERPRAARLSLPSVELPPAYKQSSFFEIQCANSQTSNRM